MDKTSKIEITEFEKEMIVKGLAKIEAEARKVAEQALGMGIPKAAKEAQTFQGLIILLQEKVMGKQKLPFETKNGKNLDAKNGR